MKTQARLVLGALGSGLVLALLPGILPTGVTGASLDPAALLGTGRMLVGLLATLFAGLLTALTPCVYPLIPITVGVLGGRGEHSRGRAVLLTSLYVFGMGLVFAALGVLAAQGGQAFGTILASRWIVIFLALLMAVLSASMFGAFEIVLPASIAQKLSGVGGAGLVGALLMGGAAGILAAPCTGPVLAGILALVAKLQSPAIGGALLFVYAMGVGLPFFVLGVFAVRLPKSGPWMEWVKSVFGIALLALSLLYLMDAFPALRDFFREAAAQPGGNWGAWLAGALCALGVVLGALHKSFYGKGIERFWKGLGIALVVLAVTFRAAALDVPKEGRWGRTPIEISEGEIWSLTLNPKTGYHKPFEDALLSAKNNKQPVLVDFFAEWCAACKELDRLTYPAQEVRSESARFLRIKVDGTNDHDEVDALYKRFKIRGLPTVLFISSEGEVLEDPRLVGFLEAPDFAEKLRQVR